MNITNESVKIGRVVGPRPRMVGGWPPDQRPRGQEAGPCFAGQLMM